MLAVRLLEPRDDTEKFHCGEDRLDDYLHRYALSAQRSGGPRTHVALADDGSIVGYYSLVNGSIERETAPARLAAGMGRYAIPVTVLARLAVAGGGQRQGVGTDLVLHAFKTAITAADMVGSRAMTVDALRQGLQGWYARFGFNEFDPGKEPQTCTCTCS